MDLLFLDTLKSISGYTSLRGVRSWLRGLNVPLIRVGKNYAVDKTIFEQQFGITHGSTPKHYIYTPITESEKAFLREISDLLSKNIQR